MREMDLMTSGAVLSSFGNPGVKHQLGASGRTPRGVIPPPCAKHSAYNEESLVAAAKAGSLTAFEQLVEHYRDRVFRVAERVAQSHEDAEEITQDAFMQAFRNLSGFRGDSRFYTWVVRITINAGLAKMRRRRINLISIDGAPQREESVLLGELEDCGLTPEQWYLRRELQEVLDTSISQLPPGHQTVFRLRDVAGLSTEETAEALVLSTSAVKSRLCRARFRLRKSLAKYFTPTNIRRTVSSSRYESASVSMPG